MSWMGGKAIVSGVVILWAASGLAQNTNKSGASSRKPTVEVNADNVGSFSDADLYAVLKSPESPILHKSCSVGLPVTSELLRRHPERSDLRRPHAFAALFCADHKKDYDGAVRNLATLEEGPAGGPLHALGLHLALRRNDADEILRRVRALATDQEGKEFVSLDRDTYWAVTRQLTELKRIQDWRTAQFEIAKLPVMAKLDLGRRSHIATGAIHAAIAANEAFRVPGLLNYVSDPYSFISLLSDREYERAWPFIETHVGDGMERAMDANVTLRRQAQLASPRNRSLVGDYAQALLQAGKFTEAGTIALDLADEVERGTRDLEEGDGWAMNAGAYALDALGRSGEADRVFKVLAELDETKKPWVVNFAINRMARLANHGRWKEALETSLRARTIASEYGSTYAKMLISTARICATARIGQTKELEEELPFVREHADDAPAEAARGLVCAGRRAEAAALLIAALGRKDDRMTVVRNLQPAAFDLTVADRNLPALLPLMDEFPQLASAFAREGRTVPKRFAPRASITRQVIPILP